MKDFLSLTADSSSSAEEISSSSEIVFSSLQQAIFAHIAESKQSLMVDAKAGSGKTFTMCESMRRLPFPEDNILALAFNKAIATTLQARVPSFVEARTFNSLGFGAVKRGLGSDMDAQKVRKILQKTVPNSYHEEYLYELRKVLDNAKAWGMGHFQPNEELTWRNLLDDQDAFDIADIYPKCIPWLLKAYAISMADTKTMDFNDQILFPLIYNLSGKQYDIIYVDEAQDLSPVQHDFIAHFLAPSGRVIMFGDPNQAIYGFRGASAESMRQLGNKFQVDILPLSISYRCPLAVIEEAQVIVPAIEAAPEAPQGNVDWISLPPIEDFLVDDLVLCRNNAPLVRLGLSFLAARKPVNVRGEFGKQLIKFIKKFKTDDIGIFAARLQSWYDVEYADALGHNRRSKASIIQDKYYALQALIEDVEIKNVSDLVAALTKLFESGIGTTLSTVHKAKGEEATCVYILRPDLMPSPFARGEEQQQQELNLKYVAITRSKSELYFITP